MKRVGLVLFLSILLFGIMIPVFGPAVLTSPVVTQAGGQEVRLLSR